MGPERPRHGMDGAVMTELEAAQKLLSLIVELEAAGHAVQVAERPHGYQSSWGLEVGSTFLAEPTFDGEPWEVRP